MIVGVGILEGILDYINNYEEDKLEGMFKSEIHLLKWMTENE